MDKTFYVICDTLHTENTKKVSPPSNLKYGLTYCKEKWSQKITDVLCIFLM